MAACFVINVKKNMKQTVGRSDGHRTEVSRLPLDVASVIKLGLVHST